MWQLSPGTKCGEIRILYIAVEVGEGVVYPLADTVETLWPFLGYSGGSFAGSTRCSSEIRLLVPHKVIYERSMLQGVCICVCERARAGGGGRRGG